MSNANLAIQVLPLHKSKQDAYKIIDVAIATIKDSGLQFTVCPFETVVEGAYEALIILLDTIQENCKNAGATEILMNMKLHRNFETGVSIASKMEKYT